MLITSCTMRVKEQPNSSIEQNTLPAIFPSNTTFPQIHANLNGRVQEFVRVMHQDQKGHYWFGTNGNGIIRYDGQVLENMVIQDVSPRMRVLEIVEDASGNLWFGTSEGLIKYDGENFNTLSTKAGFVAAEIWGVTIDKNGLIWLGSTEGVFQFDGATFKNFPLPDAKVENRSPMLTEKTIFKIIADKKGTLWFATDGNGIFQYREGNFIHLTEKNGLPDNHVADIFEDQKGHIWIGTFYGGVSKFDGETFTHFTKNGTIAGEEAYNLFEDRQGHIWFTAEGYGVYRFDGKTFEQFTTKDGLTSNVTLSIFQDSKGQIWFGSWQGLSIFDGKTFTDAKNKEPWAG